MTRHQYQSNIAVGQSVRDFIYRSIASGGDDQLPYLLDGLAC